MRLIASITGALGTEAREIAIRRFVTQEKLRLVDIQLKELRPKELRLVELKELLLVEEWWLLEQGRPFEEGRRRREGLIHVFLAVLWEGFLEILLFLCNFSEFPNKHRPHCTTMPWNIRPALVVLWGVCWMFKPYSVIDDTQFQHSNELDWYCSADLPEYNHLQILPPEPFVPANEFISTTEEMMTQFSSFEEHAPMLTNDQLFDLQQVHFQMQTYPEGEFSLVSQAIFQFPSYNILNRFNIFLPVMLLTQQQTTAISQKIGWLLPSTVGQHPSWTFRHPRSSLKYHPPEKGYDLKPQLVLSLSTNGTP